MLLYFVGIWLSVKYGDFLTMRNLSQVFYAFVLLYKDKLKVQHKSAIYLFRTKVLHFYAALFLGSFYKLFRAVGSFFCDWGLSKNVGHNGWPTKKNFKITLTKHPKTVTKKLKFGPENKFFKTSYLEFTFSFQIF